MVPESQVPIHQFNSLVAQLSQHVAEIAYEFDDIPFTIDQKLSELTSIYFMTMDTRIGGKQVVQLARRNASTLQKLSIGVHNCKKAAGLFQNPAGGYVQYPRLHMLRLSDWQDVDDDSQQIVFPGAVPFPSLRFLDIENANFFWR